MKQTAVKEVRKMEQVVRNGGWENVQGNLWKDPRRGMLMNLRSAYYTQLRYIESDVGRLVRVSK